MPPVASPADTIVVECVRLCCKALAGMQVRGYIGDRPAGRFGATSLGDLMEKKKVLVIDDSNTIRRSAEIFLKQGGHEVMLAEDGFDALAKVSDAQPDLIFCDILMPRLDGYQTCAIIKRNERFASTPVVMLSSKDGVFDKARGRMVGSQDYLTKPFTKDQLLKAVQQFGSADGGNA